PPTTHISPLSLHDALPISTPDRPRWKSVFRPCDKSVARTRLRSRDKSSARPAHHQSWHASHASCQTSTQDRCRPCVRGFAVLAAILKRVKTSRSHRKNKSRMQAGWDAFNGLSDDSYIARFPCEFEACQWRRPGIYFFFKREDLKCTTEHFRVE